jgi:hypothetical protein
MLPELYRSRSPPGLTTGRRGQGVGSRRLELGFSEWLVEGLEVFAGFEADGFTGSDADLGTGAGIAADAGFAGLDGEDAEAAELDAVAFNEALLHGVEDGVDGGFRLGANETGAFYDSLDKILLDQGEASRLQ